ncbi:hypothetical protein XAC4311_2190003 [Xanthomonas citri pv. citri]|nr:hypothetical protein XAC4311_2190003 [Xanthomonas citri pv. citri]
MPRRSVGLRARVCHLHGGDARLRDAARHLSAAVCADQSGTARARTVGAQAVRDTPRTVDTPREQSVAFKQKTPVQRLQWACIERVHAFECVDLRLRDLHRLAEHHPVHRFAARRRGQRAFVAIEAALIARRKKRLGAHRRVGDLPGLILVLGHGVEHPLEGRVGLAGFEEDRQHTQRSVRALMHQVRFHRETTAVQQMLAGVMEVQLQGLILLAAGRHAAAIVQIQLDGMAGVAHDQRHGAVAQQQRAQVGVDGAVCGAVSCASTGLLSGSAVCAMPTAPQPAAMHRHSGLMRRDRSDLEAGMHKLRKKKSTAWMRWPMPWRKSNAPGVAGSGL